MTEVKHLICPSCGSINIRTLNPFSTARYKCVKCGFVGTTKAFIDLEWYITTRPKISKLEEKKEYNPSER